MTVCIKRFVPFAAARKPLHILPAEPGSTIHCITGRAAQIVAEEFHTPSIVSPAVVYSPVILAVLHSQMAIKWKIPSSMTPTLTGIFAPNVDSKLIRHRIPIVLIVMKHVTIAATSEIHLPSIMISSVRMIQVTGESAPIASEQLPTFSTPLTAVQKSGKTRSVFSAIMCCDLLNGMSIHFIMCILTAIRTGEHVSAVNKWRRNCILGTYKQVHVASAALHTQPKKILIFWNSP